MFAPFFNKEGLQQCQRRGMSILRTLIKTSVVHPPGAIDKPSFTLILVVKVPCLLLNLFRRGLQPNNDYKGDRQAPVIGRGENELHWVSNVEWLAGGVIGVTLVVGEGIFRP